MKKTVIIFSLVISIFSVSIRDSRAKEASGGWVAFAQQAAIGTAASIVGTMLISSFTEIKNFVGQRITDLQNKRQFRKSLRSIQKNLVNDKQLGLNTYDDLLLNSSSIISLDGYVEALKDSILLNSDLPHYLIYGEHFEQLRITTSILGNKLKKIRKNVEVIVISSDSIINNKISIDFIYKFFESLTHKRKRTIIIIEDIDKYIEYYQNQTMLVQNFRDFVNTLYGNQYYSVIGVTLTKDFAESFNKSHYAKQFFRKFTRWVNIKSNGDRWKKKYLYSLLGKEQKLYTTTKKNSKKLFNYADYSFFNIPEDIFHNYTDSEIKQFSFDIFLNAQRVGKFIDIDIIEDSINEIKSFKSI